MEADGPVRLAVRVQGAVQGVGFRPFVHALGRRLALTGHVGNDAAGVFIEVEGDAAATEAFVRSLRLEPPPLAVVESVVAERIPSRGTDVATRPGVADAGFVILPSRAGDRPTALVSPDSATCADCLAELADPADRRHRYPFINCTNCGPRFTIVRGIPYDRPLTTMAPYPMCPDCAREYADPTDRRFHAQPVCCPACGPRLRLVDADGRSLPPAGSAADPAAAADRAVELLRSGHVVAVKGLGGFHLAVDAGNEEAAALLRSRKHREDKPFAVMVPDLAWADRLCEVDALAGELLGGIERPIVLLPRRDGAPVAAAVAPGNRRLGLMLPYTPVHHLLLGALGGPLVMTSGNLSDEPIVHRDEELGRLAPVADAVLTHDRAIHVRCDDSVVGPHRGRGQLLRRSRGWVPRPLDLPVPSPVPLLACGPELKHTFCLATGARALVSHHVGDLENLETMRSFTEGVAHFQRLFEVAPQILVHDLHPEYLSTKYAVDRAGEEGLQLTGVQHHHAHIASCLADNREAGPVIGVAFDGLGYGEDGALWGGEVLVADLLHARRAAHLSPVPMPGGTTAIRQPWRLAIAQLDAAGLDPDELHSATGLAGRHPDWPRVRSVSRSRLSPVTTSAGRLFDAVAALLDVRDEVTYEGQAAIELEQLADPAETAGYPMHVDAGEPRILRSADLVTACLDDRRAGVPRELVAARFHRGLAAGVARACRLVREDCGLDTVALSGGVFQNLLLTDRLVELLEADGFRVLTHRRVPTNDGGISLGQAAVAAARQETGRSPGNLSDPRV